MTRPKHHHSLHTLILFAALSACGGVDDEPVPESAAAEVRAAVPARPGSAAIRGEALRTPARVTQPVARDCVVAGCSGEVCADAPEPSLCVWRPEYACYSRMRCERQPDGACGWSMTAAAERCFSDVGGAGRE